MSKAESERRYLMSVVRVSRPLTRVGKVSTLTALRGSGIFFSDGLSDSILLGLGEASFPSPPFGAEDDLHPPYFRLLDLANGASGTFSVLSPALGSSYADTKVENRIVRSKLSSCMVPRLDRSWERLESSGEVSETGECSSSMVSIANAVSRLLLGSTPALLGDGSGFCTLRGW